MKAGLLFATLSLASFAAFGGESFGCMWAKAKLETAIEMQSDYKEKQRFYVEENGSKSPRYELGLESAREDEREARAEVNRKCE